MTPKPCKTAGNCSRVFGKSMGVKAPNNGNSQSMTQKPPKTVKDEVFGHIDKSVLTDSMIEALEGN